MPLTLAIRMGPDTLGKLEQAARRRYAEALKLASDEPLGAIYLFGYTIEMRLKTAYYRLIGLTATSQLSRTIAEGQIRELLGRKGAVGHDLYGWALLLEQTRGGPPGPGALSPAVQAAMYEHVQNVALCWTEVLRYRATPPYDEELQAVRAAAKWFRTNYKLLWS